MAGRPKLVPQKNPVEFGLGARSSGPVYVTSDNKRWRWAKCKPCSDLFAKYVNLGSQATCNSCLNVHRAQKRAEKAQESIAGEMEEAGAAAAAQATPREPARGRGGGSSSPAADGEQAGTSGRTDAAPPSFITVPASPEVRARSAEAKKWILSYLTALPADGVEYQPDWVANTDTPLMQHLYSLYQEMPGLLAGDSSSRPPKKRKRVALDLADEAIRQKLMAAYITVPMLGRALQGKRLDIWTTEVAAGKWSTAKSSAWSSFLASVPGAATWWAWVLHDVQTRGVGEIQRRKLWGFLPGKATRRSGGSLLVSGLSALDLPNLPEALRSGQTPFGCVPAQWQHGDLRCLVGMAMLAMSLAEGTTPSTRILPRSWAEKFTDEAACAALGVTMDHVRRVFRGRRGYETIWRRYKAVIMSRDQVTSKSTSCAPEGWEYGDISAVEGEIHYGPAHGPEFRAIFFEVASTGSAPPYNSTDDHYPPWWFATVFGSCAAIARMFVEAGREVKPVEVIGEGWSDAMQAEWAAACSFVEGSAGRAAAQERLAAAMRQSGHWHK